MGSRYTLSQVATKFREMLSRGRIPDPSAAELDGVWAERIEVFHGAGRGFVDGKLQVHPHDKSWRSEDLAAQSNAEQAMLDANLADGRMDEGRVYQADDALIVTGIWRGRLPDGSELYSPICFIWGWSDDGIMSCSSYGDSAQMAPLSMCIDHSILGRYWRP